MMLIPDFLYEAIILSVDYSTGYCSVSPLNPRKDNEIQKIAIPYTAGSGNSGFWSGHLKRGSRVVVANTSGEGEQFATIIAYIPQKNLFNSSFNNNKPDETPSGTRAYPQIVEGRVVIRGDNGSELFLGELGDLHLNAGGGGAGSYFKKYGIKNVAEYNIVHDLNIFNNSGRSYSGTARRVPINKRSFYPTSTLNKAPLFVDLDFHNVGVPIGFFNGSKALKHSYGNKKRNPEISEHRIIINEFSTDSMFTGFDDEVERIKGNKKLFENSESSERYREPSNNLQLAEHELIEIIGGNLIDFKGNILDLNYRAISYGDPGNRTPKKDIDLGYKASKIISRRGIGAHALLSTNVESNQRSDSDNSLLFDIDKEGLVKISIPKSSDTGNIPFSGLTTFSDATGNVSTTFSNPSVTEPIPVTLRDKDGVVVLPQTADRIYRETGIRYSNSDINPYFPGTEGKTVRVNSTKYHNMYAVAERLIANNISKIQIPETFVNDFGFVEGNAFGHPFEVYDNSSDESTESSPSFMSIIKVSPAAPVIYSGGDTVVAGTNFADDSMPFSNSFVLENDSAGNAQAKIIDPVFGDERAKVGGKSASLNFEGSLEASIGADNYDRKSLVLDTAGSIIAWLGKDAKGRSLVMQTDGEMLVNIGGTYEGSDPENQKMNVGKFVLRVNVTDKKHLGTNLQDENPKADSDYIISISDEGLVIAGMKQGKPMIIRNDGKILIESSTDLVLKANKIEQISAKGKATTSSVPGRG